MAAAVFPIANTAHIERSGVNETTPLSYVNKKTSREPKAHVSHSQDTGKDEHIPPVINDERKINGLSLLIQFSRYFMHIQYLRLSSFLNWTAGGSVSVIRLAKVGLFYRDQGDDAVQCFHCHVVIMNWKRGDSPDERHKQASPSCDFVLNRQTRNVPYNSCNDGITQKAISSAIQSLTSSGEITDAAMFSELLSGTRTNTHASTNNTAQAALPLSGINTGCSRSESFDSVPRVQTGQSDYVTDNGEVPERNDTANGNTNANDSSFVPSHMILTSMGSYNEGARDQHTAGQTSPERQTGDVSTGANAYTSTGSEVSANGDPRLKEEHIRLETFRGKWPSEEIIRGCELAEAGFYYTGVSDRVKCAFCRGVLKSWKLGVIAIAEHKSFFPNCPFVQGEDVGNVPLMGERSTRQREVLSGDTMPTSSIYGSAKYKEYVTESVRLESFKYWPLQLTQKPRSMAEAGFFYTGRGDSVKCFCCGGGMFNFELDDDIWESHAAFFPNCVFIKQHKSDLFIAEAIAKCTQTKDTKSSAVCRKKSNQGKNITKVSSAVPVRHGNTVTNSDKNVFEELKLLRTKHEEVKRERACKICMDEEISHLFLPCGHLLACGSCASTLRICPMCRRKIMGIVRAYYA